MSSSNINDLISSSSTGATRVHPVTMSDPFLSPSKQGLVVSPMSSPPSSSSHSPTHITPGDIDKARLDERPPINHNQTPVQVGSDDPLPGSKKPKKKNRIIGFKERIALNDEKFRNSAGTPDNWITRYFAVILVFALITWAYYVFVGRLVTPMLQRRDRSGGSVGEGAGLLVGFNVLWLMFVWSYIKVISTKPGNAIDFVTKEPDSIINAYFGNHGQNRQLQYLGTSQPAPAGGGQQASSSPFDDPVGLNNMTPAQQIVFQHRQSTGELTLDTLDLDRSGAVEEEQQKGVSADPAMTDGARNLLPSQLPLPHFRFPAFPSPASLRQVIADEERFSDESYVRDGSVFRTISTGIHDSDVQASPPQPESHENVTDGQGHTRHLSAGTPRAQGSSAHLNPYPPASQIHNPDKFQSGYQQAGGFSHNPPPPPGQTFEQDQFLEERPLPPFNPNRQLCRWCKIYKPPRCHHCRHCGTCVLAMDHHCPWVGGCVGWFNHKFFIIFCFWSTMFTVYVAVVFVVVMSMRSEIDGQMVALTCLSGFFSIFTITMFISHVGLITSALTTLESFSVRTQRDRERLLLSQKYGFLQWRTKSRVVKKWNQDYGDLKTEGNRWYIGPAMWEWKRTMGDDPLGWILPIGRPKGDGMEYEQNPRFGPSGERRKREDWPEHLR